MSHTPVPEDRFGRQDGFAEEFAALWASIEAHPGVGDTLLLSGITSLRGGQ